MDRNPITGHKTPRVGFFWFKGKKKLLRQEEAYGKKKKSMESKQSYYKSPSAYAVKSQAKIILRFYPDNSTNFKTIHSHSTQRIFAKVRHANFTKSHLKVVYGKDTTNEGFYYSREDLTLALKAFLEVKNYAN